MDSFQSYQGKPVFYNYAVTCYKSYELLLNQHSTQHVSSTNVVFRPLFNDEFDNFDTGITVLYKYEVFPTSFPFSFLDDFSSY